MLFSEFILRTVVKDVVDRYKNEVFTETGFITEKAIQVIEADLKTFQLKNGFVPSISEKSEIVENTLQWMKRANNIPTKKAIAAHWCVQREVFLTVKYRRNGISNKQA